MKGTICRSDHCRSDKEAAEWTPVEQARRRAVWIIVAGTAIGAALIALARRALPGVSPAQAPLVLAAVGALAVVPLLGLAAYLWRPRLARSGPRSSCRRAWRRSAPRRR
jgi:hypothetical protein